MKKKRIPLHVPRHTSNDFFAVLLSDKRRRIPLDSGFMVQGLGVHNPGKFPRTVFSQSSSPTNVGEHPWIQDSWFRV
jgi:hypothetical protein